MTSSNTFRDLPLSDELQRAVADLGYEHPTPIQAQAIPLVLEGHDLLAAAQTGTGKTAGFTLPILQLLSRNPPRGPRQPGRPRCLILSPTRELTAQIAESVRDYGKYLKLQSLVIFGGVNINPQFNALRSPVDILVATPGRLLDHAGQRSVDLSGVEIFVLDEADRMLDMGFIHDIRRVLRLLPERRQNLLFSATFSPEIRGLAKGLLHQPREVEVAARNTASELVDQSVHFVNKDRKRALLSYLIGSNNWRQVLVFTKTKHGANRLAEQLCRDGIEAMAIHGNKSQGARTRALGSFKDGTLPVLVATDIAARGLDIDELPHVVNYELPHVPEDYVHRIGRTGRAGSEGFAISLVERDEIKLLTAIEKLIRRTITRVEVEDFTGHQRGPVPVAERDYNPPRPPQPPARRHGSHGSESRGSAGSGRPQGRGGPGGGGHGAGGNAGGANGPGRGRAPAVRRGDQRSGRSGGSSR